MSFDALLEGLGEEVLGSLCGLPPGTMAVAKAAGVLAAGATGESEPSSSQKASATVDRHSEGLDEDEKRVTAIAVGNLAVQIKRDHFRLSKRTCVQKAMSILVLNNRLYRPPMAARHFKIALEGGPTLRREMMRKVLRDGRRYLR